MPDGPKKEKSATKPEEDDTDDEEEEKEAATLHSQFVAFIRFKNPDSEGTRILLSQSDFWMKQAKVIKGRELTTTDTGICYFQQKKYQLDFDEFNEFLKTLAQRKKIPVDTIIDKLINCGPPVEEEKKPVMGAKLGEL